MIIVFKRTQLIHLICAFTLISASCQLQQSEYDVRNQFQISATETKSATNKSTDITATSALTETQNPIPADCNKAQLITPATEPIGAVYQPGESFNKIWRLKNVGTCLWSSDYQIIFFSGEKLQADRSIPIGIEVTPGETADISVPMSAPLNPGLYSSEWMLVDTNGQMFGTGKDATQPLKILVQVVQKTNNTFRYDFAANFCSADWSSSAGKIPCISVPSDNGFVEYNIDSKLETLNGNEPALIMHPDSNDNKWIQAIFPEILIERNDHFVAQVSCITEIKGCEVEFQLNFIDGNGMGNTIATWNQHFDGRTTIINYDLTKFAGQKIRLILRVQNKGNQSHVSASWISPSIRSSTLIAENTVVHPTLSRGYQTTPGELYNIAGNAIVGIEPYASAVENVLEWAAKDWNYQLQPDVTCGNANSPPWNDDKGGTRILYAKALAYNLTGDDTYGAEVKAILEQIMTQVLSISQKDELCELTFSWGTPELVASADLIENYWIDKDCSGPASTIYGQNEIIVSNCKYLFQNWLVKNPYYIVSAAAEERVNNWGASGTNTLAYIADYLWDRPEVTLINRTPVEVYGTKELHLSPAEAYSHANKLAIERMNGYRVDMRGSHACDRMATPEQSLKWDFVKSQITELGIIPDEARREEVCNIPQYNGQYQNYPQLHLGSNIQQCELMLRRGDSSCYNNVDWSDVPKYTFMGPDGLEKATHLYPGRGSIERAIKAVIVDSGTEWHYGSALELAYRYYFIKGTLNGIGLWYQELLKGRPYTCDPSACFGTLTHGFNVNEIPTLPPTVPPP